MLEKCPICKYEVANKVFHVKVKNVIRHLAGQECHNCGWIWATESQRKFNRSNN